MSHSSEAVHGKSFWERHRGKLFVAQAVAFIAVGVLFAQAFRGGSTNEETVPVKDSGDATAKGETLWTCSMHPQIRQPNPGKCPICGMDLIPVVKTAGGMRTLALSSESRALMKIDTAPVERKYVTHEIPMVGRVDYDETKLGYITAWVPGRLDRLYVDYTGVEVKPGDHLVDIYSEQLYSAQEELIQALKYSRNRDGSSKALGQIDLVESAREKLRLLGLKEEQIREIEKLDKPSDHITIYAPLGGIVIDKLKQQGERVQLGERVYTIADLSQVWVHLDAYESDLPWVRYGQDVTITTEAYPGDKFHGRIAFVQPVLNDKTRTVKVRVNVPNPSGKLKPEMFVHAVVRPRVATGGKVMDPSLAGKWISPMHPEIVKDQPGKCDICGMPLVRAESLGYVTPTTDEEKPPLVIPYSAALVTGTRAIVYVQLPNIPTFAEPAIQTLSTVVSEGDLTKIREAFATYAHFLERPYDQPGTEFARRSWNDYAGRLDRLALAGQRSAAVKEAEQTLKEIESTMTAVRESFAPPDRPTFEGREIVLGPRAGDYLLVRHGLEEGELVVTQGNFKIDAEIQIQAKPSMMTPEGGGGGGHDHGGHGSGTKQKSSGEEHAGHKMALPTEFVKQVTRLEEAYEAVSQSVGQGDIGKLTADFTHFGEVLNEVDGSSLTGHARMQWKEFSMLLGNDAAEGSEAKLLPDAERVFLLLKGHMRRMREQLGIMSGQEQPPIERLAVTPQFQAELARLWQNYLAVGEALASDKFEEIGKPLAEFKKALAELDDKSLSGRALEVWENERSNLTRLMKSLNDAADVSAARAQFLPFSQEIGLLAKTFGFAETHPVYELHCPMAFQGKGAVWYQDKDQVRNPYFGSTMLKCADRVEQIVSTETAASELHKQHQNH